MEEEEPERNLRLLEEEEPVFTRVDEPLPDINIINVPEDAPPPEVTVRVKSASRKGLPNVAYGAIGAFVGVTLGYMIRKASK